MYGDIMNFYGEYANISILERYLVDCGAEVEVDTLSLYEDKDISGYDFYYMGSGTEDSQKTALAQLMKYKDILKKMSDDGKTILFTGNAFELLGSKITDANGNEYDALGIGGFETTEKNKRITGDCLAKNDDCEDIFIGFVNKCSITKGVEKPMFKMMMGYGNECELGDEGFVRLNTMGTHLIGPIIIKNPHFLKFIAGKLGLDIKKEFPKQPTYEYMTKSYQTGLKELKNRIEQN